ncbi:MAG: hypothetical protein CUN55_18560, partial [Phototrophicales bacterium]
ICGLVDEYCLRDWGLNETAAPLQERKDQVMAALHRGELLVQFSQEDQRAHLINVSELPQVSDVEYE